MITDAKSFGETSRKRRRELGYTQAFLAEFSGFSVIFISDLENGKSTTSNIYTHLYYNSKVFSASTMEGAMKLPELNFSKSWA